MRALHIVKTSDGAVWAARQAAELVRLGVDVHVVLPQAQGRTVSLWRNSGVTIHFADLDLPLRRPWLLPGVLREVRRIVSAVGPDVIHSHFFGTTVAVRLALGRAPGIPRVFQVPGPLHLEHSPFRTMDLRTAGDHDFWIGSSRCIQQHYLRAGVDFRRLFLSYYGIFDHSEQSVRRHQLHRRLGIPPEAVVVGNANLIYAPKWFLGQQVGLKCHEDVIDALEMVQRRREDVFGVLIGGVFGRGAWYESRLRRRAQQAGRGRILMPGFVSASQVRQYWPDFDCAVHVPLSENCGGAVEPLAAAVPVIASRVGGLPEIVIDGVTGATVAPRNPAGLAAMILEVLDDLDRYRILARRGQRLVRATFDVSRTAREVHQIYRHVLDAGVPRPAEFDTAEYAKDSCEEIQAHA